MDVLQYTLDGLARRVGRPAAAGDDPVAAVEAALGNRLPQDMHTFAAVLPRGRVHRYEQFAWDVADPAGVVATTRRLRGAGLRPADVALGTDRERLYLWDGRGLLNTARLASATPLQLKAPLKKNHVGSVRHTNAYADLMLEELETAAYEPVRADLDARHEEFTKRAAKRWRHRWQPHEAEKIDLALRRGIRPADAFPSVTDHGVSYVDLRGVVIDPSRRPYWHPQPPDPETPARIERVDLSFSELHLHRIDAHDCRFRAARVGCWNSRFVNCDFTFADVAGAHRSILQGDFTDCNFTGAHLAECSLHGTFRRCLFTGADLWWAGSGHTDLTSQFESQFIDCTWTHCRFGGGARHWDERRWEAFPRL